MERPSPHWRREHAPAQLRPPRSRPSTGRRRPRRPREAVGSAGSGRWALAQSARTLPVVSAPSSVVRSTMRMARSIAHALALVLIERVLSVAARASAPTWSTPGSPRRKGPQRRLRAGHLAQTDALDLAAAHFNAGLGAGGRRCHRHTVSPRRLPEPIDRALADAVRSIDAPQRLVVPEGARRELLAGARIGTNIVGPEPGGHAVDRVQQLGQGHAFRPVHPLDASNSRRADSGMRIPVLMT